MQGIPIDELITWNEKLRRIQNTDVKPALTAGDGPEVAPIDDFDELSFIRGVESDFAGQAEGVLQRLNLSHLLVQPQK